MKSTTLVIVHHVAGLSGEEDSLREQLWAKTTQVLQPMLGTLCGRFEPAQCAWGQKVTQHCGVILGRSDPALFLYFFAVGRESQEQAVKYHMDRFLDKFDLGEAFEEGNVAGFTMEPKANSEQMIAAHLRWHLGMMAGELFPDAGIYFVPARQAVISEKLSEQVVKDIDEYAIAVVRVCDSSGTGE